MSTPPPNISFKITGSNGQLAKNPVLQQLARLLHTHTLRCAVTLAAYLEVLRSPLSVTHIVNDRTHVLRWLEYLRERGDPRGLEPDELLPPLPNREDVKDALSEFPEIVLQDFTAGKKALHQSWGFTIKSDNVNRIHFCEDLAAELERATECEPQSQHAQELHLLTLIILLHERAHLLTRQIFGSLRTPSFGCRGIYNEAGLYVESVIFHFLAQAEWENSEEMAGEDRMRYFRLVGQESHPVPLSLPERPVRSVYFDKASLTALLESFKDEHGAPIADVITAQNLPVAATPPLAGRIRWRVGDVPEPDDDRWEPDGPYLAGGSDSPSAIVDLADGTVHIQPPGTCIMTIHCGLAVERGLVAHPNGVMIAGNTNNQLDSLE